MTSKSALPARSMSASTASSAGRLPWMSYSAAIRTERSLLRQGRNQRLRHRRLKRGEVREVALRVRAHVLPVREQHQRQVDVRNADHVRAGEARVREASRREIARLLPTEMRARREESVDHRRGDVAL